MSSGPEICHQCYHLSHYHHHDSLEPIYHCKAYRKDVEDPGCEIPSWCHMYEPTSETMPAFTYRTALGNLTFRIGYVEDEVINE